MDLLRLEPEIPDDVGAVRELLRRAFDGDRVPAIVDAIRASPGYEPALALVARVGSTVIGFGMISHAELEDDAGSRRDVLTLSPLAVAEPYRRTGIGAQLVRTVLAAAGARSDLPRLVVLEGSPTYYGRLGFTFAPESGVEFDLPEWAPPAAAQVYRLPGYDPALRGRVRYPAGFDEDPVDERLTGLVADATRLLGREVRGIRMLGGGEHAITAAVADGDRHLVVRRFPDGDPAVEREVAVLPRLDPLGETVPQLVAHDAEVIVTTRVAGAPPDPRLRPDALALMLAHALVRVHALDPTGLRAIDGGPPGSAPVLVHNDAWSGNLLWNGHRVTGIVDWSGAGVGPPERDLAWCRNDLVLLGDPAAADEFLQEYRRASGRDLAEIPAWDRWAAERADPVVETWAANYAGIGRPEIDGPVLRARLDAWMRALGMRDARG